MSFWAYVTIVNSRKADDPGFAMSFTHGVGVTLSEAETVPSFHCQLGFIYIQKFVFH